MGSSTVSEPNRRIYADMTDSTAREEPEVTVDPKPEAAPESPWADPQTYAGLAGAALGFFGTVGKAVGAAAVSTGEAVGSASKVAGAAINDVFDRL